MSTEAEHLREAKKRDDATIADYREKLARPGAVSEESAEYVPLLAQLIQEEKVIPIEKAKNMFGIENTDVEALRAIGAAVDALASMGLVEKGISDWRWVGGASGRK